MKINSILASLLVLLGVGMMGCKEDTQPRLEKPTEFVLNTPPAANELYMLRADEKNNSLYDVKFSCSQPNYGLGCVPQYQIQVAKDAAGFTAWDEAIKADPTRNPDEILGADGNPLVATLETIFTNAQMTVAGNIFADGVNKVYGFDQDNYNGEAVPVEVRVHAWMPNANYSSIFSNSVTLKQVSSYIPISEPGVLYLIGQPSGWDINNGEMKATETAIGSKIYYGVFSVPEGQFQFRFYSALGDWEHNSIGAQVEDNPVDIAFTDGKYNGPCFDGKGSWQVADWAGGKVAVTIDLNAMTVSMEMFEGNKIYVIGACSGWDINNDKVYVTEKEEGTGIYTGTISVNAGEFQFRFYTALGDWEHNSIGSQEEDSPVEISMATGTYSGPCVNGKGSWQCPDWAGGDVKITLNTTTMEVAFEKI